MASSREQANYIQSLDDQNTSKEDLLDFETLKISAPPSLPSKAKPIGKLTFPKKEEEDKKPRTSYHAVNTAFHTKNLEEKKYFKQNGRGSILSELEALCSSFYAFLTPDTVSKTRAYYDEKSSFEFIGVTSDDIPHWSPNRETPLDDKDLIIEMDEFQVQLHRNKLLKKVEELLLLTNRSDYSYFNLFKATKTLYNSYVSTEPTADQIHGKLMEFKKTSDRFSLLNLNLLKEALTNRVNHIKKQNDAKYNEEINAHKAALVNLNALCELTPKIGVQTDNIAQIEEILKTVIRKGIVLSQVPGDTTYGKKFGEQLVVVKARDLINYQTVTGLAYGLTASYLFKEGDCHNKNIAKDGKRIDFDMSLWDILCKFKESNFIHFVDRMVRRPNANSFEITAEDIDSFPYIKANGYYYWPTKVTQFNESLVKNVSEIFNITENLFRKIDNDTFKKLSTHPVFIFAKFKTLLKYCLCNADMFRGIGKLHLREDFNFRDEADGKTKNLLSEIVNDQGARIEQLRAVLVKMPAFQEFLSIHGKFAYEKIQAEFFVYRKHLEDKIEFKLCSLPQLRSLYEANTLHKHYQKLLSAKDDGSIKEAREVKKILDYQEIIKSIDLGGIKNKYDEIFAEAQADIVHQQAIVPLSMGMKAR